MVERRYVFTLLKALNERSLVAFEAGMTRISFNTVHTSAINCFFAGERLFIYSLTSKILGGVFSLG